MEVDWLDIKKAYDINIGGTKLVNFMIRLTNLREIHLFKNLSEIKLIELCTRMKKTVYQENEVVFEEGSAGDCFYLLYKGKVKALKGDKFLREIQEKSCFGERSLLLSQKHSATIKAVEKSTIFVLSRDDFFSLLDKNILEYLTHKISLQDNFSLTLEDLYFIKNLGEGKFGYVSLVHNKKNSFAIKAVNKKAADKQKILISYLKKERNILLSLDHQFIVKLVKTMKNEEFIFFLMEYVNGLPLSSYLDHRKEHQIKNKTETQFYIATLLVIIDYLNARLIAHRDIKPDNIMIDDKGYLKMIDFGTAVVLKDFTNTIVGTPYYIAPEILLGKGYSFSADYWSIGVTAYEIYYGKYPFGNKASDPMVVYKDILKK
jgi:cGMP-dependent protein kinase